MNRNRRIGTITIVAAAFIALAAIAFSSNACYPEAPLTTVFLHCVQIELPQFMATEDYLPAPTLLTKYVLLVAAAIASIGFLWLIGALSVPGDRKAEVQQSPTHEHQDEP